MINKGKSICLFSSRGGTGKSTLALNLAGTFSSLGKKVLIIDFDTTGGAIGALLNKNFDKTLFNITDDSLNNRFTKVEDYVTKYKDNIYFIPSPKDPRQGVRINSNIVNLVIEKAVFNYDIIICDTNHVLSECNVALLDKVDEILLVMQNDLLDLKNTRNLIRIFHDVEKTNFETVLYNVNPNKKYFSIYEIKNIIKTNIDFLIDSSFYLKNYDNYTNEGKIACLDKNFTKHFLKPSKALNAICQSIIGGDKNEK